MAETKFIRALEARVNEITWKNGQMIITDQGNIYMDLPGNKRVNTQQVLVLQGTFSSIPSARPSGVNLTIASQGGLSVAEHVEKNSLTLLYSAADKEYYECIAKNINKTNGTIQLFFLNPYGVIYTVTINAAGRIQLTSTQSLLSTHAFYMNTTEKTSFKNSLDIQNGETYVPTVDADGNLTWSISAESPIGANIKGPPGTSVKIVNITNGEDNGIPIKIIRFSDGTELNLPVGSPGDNGVTFTPSVSEDGELSWQSSDSRVDPPVSVNIRGSRGTGLLPVTTAPSSYTTEVNGLTPAYRIALDTVKSQAGVTEVLVGDTIRYSYYHYPVIYIDNTYAYCRTRVNIRGAAGAAGGAGADGASATHTWDGSNLIITSASGTSTINIAQMLQEKLDAIPTAASQGAIF